MTADHLKDAVPGRGQMDIRDPRDAVRQWRWLNPWGRSVGPTEAERLPAEKPEPAPSDREGASDD